MKLAEALAERADATRRVAELRGRIVLSARFQEGEEPAEQGAELLAEAARVLERLEELIRRINRTNSATVLPGGATITDALARRDVLRQRHSLVVAAADAASGQEHDSYSRYGRQLRSELRMFAALDVTALRAQADGLARELRELDVTVQRANWDVDLAD